MKLSVSLVAICVAALSSCAPTRAEYEQLQTVMQGSPALKRDVIRDCIARKRFSKAELPTFAKLMNVPEKDVEKAYCNRLHQSIASGRLKYEDIQEVYKSNSSTNLIKIMQGR